MSSSSCTVCGSSDCWPDTWFKLFIVALLELKINYKKTVALNIEAKGTLQHQILTSMCNAYKNNKYIRELYQIL